MCSQRLVHSKLRIVRGNGCVRKITSKNSVHCSLLELLSRKVYAYFQTQGKKLRAREADACEKAKLSENCECAQMLQTDRAIKKLLIKRKNKARRPKLKTNRKSFIHVADTPTSQTINQWSPASLPQAITHSPKLLFVAILH